MTDAARADGPVTSSSAAHVVERVAENRGAPAPRREVRRLIRAARHELSVRARFRGLVSLRSLRSVRGA